MFVEMIQASSRQRVRMMPYWTRTSHLGGPEHSTSRTGRRQKPVNGGVVAAYLAACCGMCALIYG